MLDKIDVGKIVADLVQSVVQKKVLLAGVCRFRNRDNLRIVNIGPKEFMGAFASFVMIPGVDMTFWQVMPSGTSRHQHTHSPDHRSYSLQC